MSTNGLLWLLVVANGAYGAILPSILWSPDNPALKKFITTPRKVMPLDKIYFVCPNPFEYPVKRELTYSKEKLYENIYMVDKAGYDSCNASGPSSMLIIKCNQPFTLQHSTVVFQGMSPTQGDPEFIPGNEYYFIGTASGNLSSLENKVGGHCLGGMKMKVYVCIDESDPKCPGGNEVVDGSWSPWGPCADGHQSRQCDSPVPDNGGAPCFGDSMRPCTPSTDQTVSPTDFSDPSKANRTGTDPNASGSTGSLKASTAVVICTAVFVLGLCLGGVVTLLIYRRFRQRQIPAGHYPESSINPVCQMKSQSRLSQISSRPSSVFSTASESARMVTAP